MGQHEVHQLVKQVSAYIYNYLGGEDEDLPKDEYDSEAREIVRHAHASSTRLSDNDVAALVRQIMSQALGHEYSMDDFQKAGQDLERIIYP